MMMTSYIALDLETTGLESKTEKITEAAALKVIDGTVRERFVTLINPGRPISEKITQLTGITDEMVRTAPLMENVIGELLAFCEGLPLLGHNILFDYRFLKQAAVNSRLECEFEAVDTLTLCRHLMPPDEKKNLSASCTWFQIPQSAAHRAEADAESAHLLYEKLKALYGKEREELFVPCPLINKAKREQPATKRQKEYLQDLIKCHRIDITLQTDTLSRSEASRLIDQIILQRGRLTEHSLSSPYNGFVGGSGRRKGSQD